MNLRFVPITISTTCLALCSALPLSAAVSNIGIYNFDGATTLASSDTDPNSTASNMVVSSTISANSFRSSAGFNYYVRTVATAANEADSFANDQFFSFTIAPEAGLTLNLSTFSFGMSPTQPGAYPFNGSTFVRSSIDGYTATLDTFTKAATVSTALTTRSIDLSAAAYQNLTGPVTFRIYFHDDSDIPTSTSTAVVNRIDNVIFSGEAVPEPSSAALLALLGGAGAFVRRRAI